MSDLAILRHLAGSTHASAVEIGISCRLAAAEVRARLAMLESMCLISGRRDPGARQPVSQRVYVVTAEGRRKAGYQRGEVDDVTASPTLTAAQVRQARALLGWTSPRLSRAAGIGFDKALKAQDDEAMSALAFMDVQVIRTALEKAGVRFTRDAAGRPSAVLANTP